MAYQKYENPGGPNDILGKIRDFCLANGWTILENCTADLAIDGSGVSDGQRLAIQKGSVFAVLRSANGRAIFKTQNNATAAQAYGIGVTCAASYSANPPSGYWYDQSNAIKLAATQEVIGAGIPVKNDANYALHCNVVSDPADMLIFSLELEEGYFQHLAIGNTQAVGNWTGGALLSGSRNSVNMFSASWDMATIEADSNHLFGMSAKASTFLRCDIDAAPERSPAVLWASGGPNGSGADACFTGKILGLPILNLSTLSAVWFPKIPHYGYLQSQNATDGGRNANTLNCISVNLPIAMYVQRDPDALMNFSQVGYVPGVDAISLKYIAPTQLYEISYPQSGNMYQVFPHCRRGGGFGYDGISIKQ